MPVEKKEPKLTVSQIKMLPKMLCSSTYPYNLIERSDDLVLDKNDYKEDKCP